MSEVIHKQKEPWRGIGVKADQSNLCDGTYKGKSWLWWKRVTCKHCLARRPKSRKGGRKA